MIYEHFRVAEAHQAVLDYSDLFSITLHGDDIQDFDTRCDQVYYQQVRFPMTRVWKVRPRCEYESLINSKQYWQ